MCLQMNILTTKLGVKPCGHWRNTISCSNIQHPFNNLTWHRICKDYGSCVRAAPAGTTPWLHGLGPILCAIIQNIPGMLGWIGILGGQVRSAPRAVPEGCLWWWTHARWPDHLEGVSRKVFSWLRVNFSFSEHKAPKITHSHFTSYRHERGSG